jgi:hypothetical protein
VDASNLTFETHNDVWKGDREHIRNTIVGEHYQDLVTSAIKESDALKKLQNEVAREELEQATKSERNELFQKLVDADPNLAQLLTNRDPIIQLPSAGRGNGGSDAGGGTFQGKYSPTFLRIEAKMRQNGIDMPINRTRAAVARTDVENGYLQRADNRGRLLVNDDVRQRFGIRAHLNDGRLVVYLQPIKTAIQVGDSFKLELGLQDDSMPQPVRDQVMVRIIEKEKPQPKPPGPGPRERSGEQGNTKGTGKPAPTHGLPSFKLLTKDGRVINDQKTEEWPEGFTEYDGGLVQELGEQGNLYKINFDNAYHLKYRLQQRGDVARDVVTEKYILGMRILMLGYEHAFRAMNEAKGGNGHGIAEFADNFRRMAARGAASTVLALAENLPKIVDKASVVASQDAE